MQYLFRLINPITLKSVSGITPKAIWCSLCYRFLPEMCSILSLLLAYFLFLLGFFLHVVHKKLTKHRSKTIWQWRAPTEVFRVKIVVFSDIQTFSETSRDFSSFPAMFRLFQKWPENFIDGGQSSSQTFSDIIKHSNFQFHLFKLRHFSTQYLKKHFTARKLTCQNVSDSESWYVKHDL